MKPILLIGILSMLMWACSPAKQTTKTSATIKQAIQDSTEYEVLVIDPQFDHWYLTNYSTAKDYSLDYYQSKNRTAVANWNHYYQTGKYRQIIEEQIDYQHGINYGIEVERRLFWYFKFIEENYRIPLFS